MERYAELTKERLLNIKCRVNETSVPRIFRFLNADRSPHNISAYNFEIPVKKIPGAISNIFKLTIGSGLTVQGADENELLVEVTAARATVTPNVYFWRLYSAFEDHTWLSGDWEFFVGKYNGVTEVDEILLGDDSVVEIVISGSGTTGGMVWGGLWNFTANAGDFPTADTAGSLYIAEDDHGVLGDADFVPAGAWMIALIDDADEFGDYSIKF